MRDAMIRVGVPVGDRAYEVVVGRGVRKLLPDVLPEGVRRVAVVTQDRIPVDVDAGVPSESFVLGDGEQAKTLASVAALCSHFARMGLTRTDAVVAVMARMLIKWRKPLGLFFMLLTLGLGYSALNTRLDPGFNKLIPLKHEYMAAFLEHSGTFSGANRILVSVEWKGEGDIYNAEFLPVLRKVNDEVFFTPGVNRASVRSIFTPNVRYIEVTEQGFNGDVVIPARFETTEAGLNQVRGVWPLENGGYFVATHAGSQVWYVDTSGIIHLFLDGRPDDVHEGDGLPFDTPGAKISEVRAVTMDRAGNLLVTENDLGFIRIVHRR